MKKLKKASTLLFSGSFDKLSTLFTAAIVALWIQCFGEWWWEETYAIIYSMLAVSVLIVWIIPWKRVSVPLQLIGLLGSTMIFSGFHWPALNQAGTTSGNRWMLWLTDAADQLVPYIWISLGVWLVVQAAVVLSKRRSGLIVVVGSALFSLSVIDSLFTPILLWQEVAAIVSIGLLWLVVSHFEQFRKRHPGSWRDLLDYPLSLVASILLIIALVMGAGVFVPSIDPVIRDPYTVWKEAHGEAVPSFIGDKIGIETVSQNGSGDSRSGYSRNDEVLGGGFTFDYSPVMEVTTNRRSYWRGETKEIYSGRGWDDVKNEIDADPVTNIAAAEPLDARRPSGVKTTRIQQTFTILREEDRYPVLFGASPISSVEMIGEEGKPFPSIRWLPDSWELRMPLNWQKTDYPDTYSITSEVTQLDEAKVRTISVEQAAGDINPIYLQLPRNLPQRVRTLAAEITKDQTDAYDKVKAIEAYLQQNYMYNNEPDLTKRTSKDMVDAFLFEMKEGYCDYFSTSMAVLTRTLGIPTRWVKGYSSGTLPVDPSMMGFGGGDPEAYINPDGAGTYTVRNSDAHSWVEVYFDGYGWLPFEPTAGFSYPYALPETAVAPEPVAVPDVTSTLEAEEADSPSIAIWVAASVAGVLLLGAASVVVLRFRRSGFSLRLGGDRFKSPNDRIVKETERLIRYCRRKGLDRSDHETVRETMNRWSGRLTSLHKEFAGVQSAFEKAKYSAQSISEEEIARFESNAKTIRERLSS